MLQLAKVFQFVTSNNQVNHLMADGEAEVAGESAAVGIEPLPE